MHQCILAKLLRFQKVTEILPFFNLLFRRCIFFRTAINVVTIPNRRTATTANVITITIPALKDKAMCFNFINQKTKIFIFVMYIVFKSICIYQHKFV